MGQSNKVIWTKGVICGLLLITAVLDFYTFVIEPKFHTFDMSFLTVLTSNVWIIFLIKFAVIGGLIYLLIGVKEASDYWRFIWIMMSLYLIIFQTVGAISNRQVAEQNPDISQAPSVEVRTVVGFNFALIWAYYPIAFSMLSFFLWNLGWRKKNE